MGKCCYVFVPDATIPCVCLCICVGAHTLTGMCGLPPKYCICAGGSHREETQENPEPLHGLNHMSVHDLSRLWTCALTT